MVGTGDYRPYSKTSFTRLQLLSSAEAGAADTDPDVSSLGALQVHRYVCMYSHSQAPHIGRLEVHSRRAIIANVELGYAYDSLP